MVIKNLAPSLQIHYYGSNGYDGVGDYRGCDNGGGGDGYSEGGFNAGV